ncbi:hypothetical protein [Vibrio campbellii]|uniref:hypothetical protein n=1 Tax=Vibrio campbellii TaxID=680 RepID=UPI00210B87C3|nr:hypothetical protein [Vibrio campbellii]UTZ44618.1 hypothetical protein HB764_25500 [Vibrio campbellii]
MLGMKKKLELTSQLNNVTRQLKSGELGMMERLKLSGERNSILAKLKVKPKSVDPEPSDSDISVEDFAKLPRREKISKLGELMFKPNWYEYELAFTPEYKLVEKGSNYVVYKDGLNNYQFGYKGHLSRGYEYWEKDAGSSKKNGGFGSWSRADRTKAMKTLSKYINAEPVDSEENELITKYKSGEFNNTKPAEFVEVMREVHAEGLSLNGVKQGAIEWFKSNPNFVSDKAA